MNEYNFDRTNQGKRCKGSTPYETFTKGVKLYNEMVYAEPTQQEGGQTKWPVDCKNEVEVSQETPTSLQ